MTSDDEGFLSRWSRRKQRVQSGEAVPAEPPPRVVAPPAVAPVQAVQPPVVETPPPPAPPLPTLDDVANLTGDADYAQFMRPGVDRGVQSAAMKKLFADPHFNIMDGLDVYIDDYSKPDPLPASMLRQLVQAKALRLFEDEDQDRQAADAPALAEPSPHDAPPAVAPPLTADENPDLQLQPDDAAGREVAGRGADAGGERRDDLG